MRKTNLPDLRRHRSISTPPVVMDQARFAQIRGNAQLAKEHPHYRKINGKWISTERLSLTWPENEDEDQRYFECPDCHEVYNRLMPAYFRPCQCNRVDMSDSDYIPQGIS